MESDLICAVARRVRDFEALHPDKPLSGLFKTVGMNATHLGHLAKHSTEFIDVLEPVNFGWGVLFGLLLAREQQKLPELSDHDLSELLKG